MGFHPQVEEVEEVEEEMAMALCPEWVKAETLELVKVEFLE